jgi:antitoxin VapB
MVEWFHSREEWHPMSLNIKNKEAYALAHELARLTGESITTAVTESVRERLERKKKTGREGMAKRLLAIGAEVAARLPPEFRTLNADDLLYDERGLPK